MTTTLPRATTRARDLVGPALRAATARLSPEVGRVVGYHLGHLDADGRPTAAGGGKGIRPTLAILGAEAAGGTAEQALPGAVAVQLVHDFSLLHDDVMDDDTERRHRPTAWTVFGVGPAVLAGDALLALAQQVLIETGRVDAIRMLNDATAALIVGQGSDLALERRADVPVDEVLSMCAGKTAALLGCAAAIGAVLCAADPAVVAALQRFGHELGLAFQAVDDLLGIWGRPEVTGKPAHSDLVQRKSSLPVAAALAAGGAVAAELRAVLAAEPLDAARAARLIEDGGGRAWVEREARRHVARAEAALDAVHLVRPARDELVALARFVTDREL